MRLVFGRLEKKIISYHLKNERDCIYVYPGARYDFKKRLPEDEQYSEDIISKIIVIGLTEEIPEMFKSEHVIFLRRISFLSLSLIVYHFFVRAYNFLIYLERSLMKDMNETFDLPWQVAKLLQNTIRGRIEWQREDQRFYFHKVMQGKKYELSIILRNGKYRIYLTDMAEDKGVLVTSEDNKDCFHSMERLYEFLILGESDYARNCTHEEKRNLALFAVMCQPI